MSVVEGKVCGTTMPLIQRPQLEVHSIFVNAGGYCSKHKHQSKINAFYVEEGELEIHRWKDYNLVDVTVLYNEDVAIVPAGEYHMFNARTDTKALEIYWSELHINDIEREIVGGVDKTLDLFNSPKKNNFAKVFNIDDLEGRN